MRSRNTSIKSSNQRSSSRQGHTHSEYKSYRLFLSRVGLLAFRSNFYRSSRTRGNPHSHSPRRLRQMRNTSRPITNSFYQHLGNSDGLKTERAPCYPPTYSLALFVNILVWRLLVSTVRDFCLQTWARELPQINPRPVGAAACPFSGKLVRVLWLKRPCESRRTPSNRFAFNRDRLLRALWLPRLIPSR